MGFWSWAADTVSSVVGSVFGSDTSSSGQHSSSHRSDETTMYEPDKVKVAQLENEKMDKAVLAQKEMMQMNADMQRVLMQAQQKGFEHSTQILKDMILSLNGLAQDRLLLIEQGHFEVVEKIEKLYRGLEQEVQGDQSTFNLEELPKMMALYEQFPKGGAAANMYQKAIETQIEANSMFFAEKLKALLERQRIMVASTVQSKDLILEQSSQIVRERMKFLEEQLTQQQVFSLEEKQPARIAPNSDVIESKAITE